MMKDSLWVRGEHCPERKRIVEVEQVRIASTGARNHVLRASRPRKWMPGHYDLLTVSQEAG